MARRLTDFPLVSLALCDRAAGRRRRPDGVLESVGVPAPPVGGVPPAVGGVPGELNKK